ncbi:MAG: hypothetical protein II010_01555, partial [Oscillospiraceae bacterium]|nr:hypothetical protein [Oscillospiraceae bacterium]
PEPAHRHIQSPFRNSIQYMGRGREKDVKVTKRLWQSEQTLGKIFIKKIEIYLDKRCLFLYY